MVERRLRTGERGNREGKRRGGNNLLPAKTLKGVGKWVIKELVDARGESEKIAVDAKCFRKIGKSRRRWG